MPDEDKKEEIREDKPETAEDAPSSEPGEGDVPAEQNSSFNPGTGVYVFFAVLAVLLIAIIVAANTVKPERPNLEKEKEVQATEPETQTDTN